MNVGFIGLGTMGFPMASNLANSGHNLIVFDSDAGVRERAAGLNGAAAAKSPGDAAARSDALFTVLPNDDAVREVYLGGEGIVEGAREGLVTCDCSTVSPEVSETLNATLSDRGVAHMDTPMLGSQPQAVDGEIFFIVGGDEGRLGEIAPLLDIMGKQHIHVGASGTGNRIKLIHNVLGAVNSVAVAESLAVCKSAGVDAETFYQVVCQGNGMAYNTYFGKRAQRVSGDNFDPTFTLDLMLKDVTLALKLIGDAGVPTPIMNETRATYDEGARAGWGKEDFSAVSRVIEKRIGKKLF